MKRSERIRDADEQRLILTGGWEREGGGRERYADRQINSNKNDRDQERSLRENCALRGGERQTD